MGQFKSARFYHNSTKYTFNDIKNVYREYPPDSGTLPVKNYRETSKISLEKNLTNNNSRFIADLKNSLNFNRFFVLKRSPVSLEIVSNLLYHTNGVTHVREFGAKKVYFRATPSASASYPIEIYIINNNIDGIEKGIFYYHPLNHELVRIRQGDFSPEIIKNCFGITFIENSPFFVILTAIESRNLWRYRQRSFRYSMMEAGYVAENLVLASSNLNLAINLIGDFVDSEINNLLGLSDSDERALLIASVGFPSHSLEEDHYKFGMRSEGDAGFQWKPEHFAREFYISSSHFLPSDNLLKVGVKLPFDREIASNIGAGEFVHLPETNPDLSVSTSQVIRSRRSSHNFARIPIELKDLASILFLMSHIPSMYGFPAYAIHLVVNAVDGLVNGIYRYNPQNRTKLEVIKRGTFRGDLSYLTLAQDAVFNCSAAVFFSVKFNEIDIFSNRGYRYAHFNVGMLSEAAYLAGNALNLGVRGIANFFDDEINSFFKLEKPDENILGGIILGRS
jgi:SagB-type dehydrogenase family enzyme